MKHPSWLFLVAVLFFQTTTFTTPITQTESLAAMPGQNLVCATSGKAQICASISNKLPAQYSNVTIYGQLKVNGIVQKGKTMSAVWHYKTTTPICSGLTASTGWASCTRFISRATKGYKVRVVVTINGYVVTTSFTPY
jgi:hypothetical protein